MKKLWVKSSKRMGIERRGSEKCVWAFTRMEY